MKKLVIMMTILLAMVMSTSVTNADPLVLEVTYRDFDDDSHPDFGWPNQAGSWYDLDLGIVENYLDSDRKPVYSGNTNHSTTGAANFYDWFHDTSANQSVPGVRTLTFNELPTGEYQYNSVGNTEFFPLDLDNQPDGDNYDSHNYYFTMELHSTFKYEAGQTFEFEGDDDVFVFIDGKLVIDLGGVHGPKYASVNVGTGELSYLVEGQNYTFDLFFAERNPTGSNFLATTNIALQTDPVVPVPGALLLGLLGFGATGMKLRKFA